MQAEQLLQQGDIEGCRSQLISQIRQAPANMQLRIFLFQLCCIQQDWQRASAQLDLLRTMSEANLPLVNTYQQIIACEQQRQGVLAAQSQSTCFGEPLEWMAHYAQALKLHLQGEFEQAKLCALNGADRATPISGRIDQQPFAWLSDGDMRFGPCFEVMVHEAYYQLPFEYVKRIDFEPVEDLRDLVWRPANLTLRNNGKFIVFMPVRYPISDTTTDAQKLSRRCDWQTPAEDFYVGLGQRVLVSDDNEFPLLNICSIEFD